MGNPSSKNYIKNFSFLAATKKKIILHLKITLLEMAIARGTIHVRAYFFFIRDDKEKFT